MEKIKLQAKKRDIVGKGLAAIRNEGAVPAVLYGKEKENINLSVNKKEFDHIYKLSGESSLILLEIDGDKSKNVLVKDVSKDPVHGSVLHVDFYQVKMSEKITTNVPLVFTGDSKAVIDLSGSLITNKDEVEVECLPGDLPHEIEVDITVLEDFDSVIHIKDIKVPEGVEIKDDPEETLALVEPPRSEEEMAELEEPVVEGEMPEAEQGEAPEETDGETKGEALKEGQAKSDGEEKKSE